MEIITNYLNALTSTTEIKSLDDINTLIQKHIEELTFCNIQILLHKDVSLDLTNVVEKMITKKEGGYCFEHNKLIYETLLFLGFNVRPLFARVLNNKEIDVPKTHRMTLLTYQNENYLIDVGFGFMSPGEALKFGEVPTVTTLNTSYIIQQVSEEIFELKIILDNGFYTLYSFDLAVYNEMDFEVGNFYSSQHKDANFVKNLVLSKISTNEVCSLRNNIYYKIYTNEKKETIINTLEKFTYILKSEFDYPIEDKDIQYLFEKFVK